MLEVSKPVDVVFNTFAGTLSGLNLGLFLEKHRQFMRCEKESGCVEKSRAGLVKVYAAQLLMDKYYLNGAEELMK